MSHTNDTQIQPIPMPRHSGLIYRKGRAYLNIRIPKDIRHLYPKNKSGTLTMQSPCGPVPPIPQIPRQPLPLPGSGK